MQCITSAEQKHFVDQGEGDEVAKHTNSNGAIAGSHRTLLSEKVKAIMQHQSRKSQTLPGSSCATRSSTYHVRNPDKASTGNWGRRWRSRKFLHLTIVLASFPFSFQALKSAGTRKEVDF